MTNTNFTSNNAFYGKNIASYPVKIEFKDHKSSELIFDNITSGVESEKIIQIDLIDQEGQVTSSVSNFLVKIKPSG